jgi:hypothetical protein
VRGRCIVIHSDTRDYVLVEGIRSEITVVATKYCAV